MSTLRDSIDWTGVNCTANDPAVTLQHVRDFLDGDHVALPGCGPAHSLDTPAAPICDVIGEDGTTDYEYCLVAVNKEWGSSLAGPAALCTNGPDALTDVVWDMYTQTFAPARAIRVVPQTPIPEDVAMYAVYARARPNGGEWSEWKHAGGIVANPVNVEPDPIPIRHIDFGFRSTGVTFGLIPRDGLPLEVCNDMLRTEIVSGAGTLSVTLADAPEVTSTGFKKRFDHDNSRVLAEMSAAGGGSIPKGTYRVWDNLDVQNRVQFAGFNGDESILQFAPGYGMQIEPAAQYSVFMLFGVRTDTKCMPAGGRYICPAPEDSHDPDRRYHGAGLVCKANGCLFVNMTAVSMYGGGILVRGAAPEGSNANDCLFLNARCSSNYGDGLIFHGSDAAAGSIYGLKAINNSGFGYLDASAYGNHIVAPHAEANHRGTYCVTNDTAAATLIGAYSEQGSAASVINHGAIALGGIRGAPYWGEGTQLNSGGEFAPFVIEMRGDPEQKRVAWGRNVEGGDDPNLVMRLNQMVQTLGFKPFNFSWRWLSSLRLAFSWVGALANRNAFEIIGPDTIWGGLMRIPELAIGSGSVRRRMGANNVQPTAEGVYSPGSFWWDTTGTKMGWRPTAHFGVGPAYALNQTVRVGNVRIVGANAFVCKEVRGGALNTGQTGATAPTWSTIADVVDNEVTWTARPTGNVLSSTPAWAAVPWPV